MHKSTSMINICVPPSDIRQFSLHREQRAAAVRVDPGDGAAHGAEAGARRYQPLGKIFFDLDK